MENDRIAKRVYVGECAGRSRKRLIDTVKDCRKKRFRGQANKENRNVERGFAWGNVWGVARGMNPRP